MEEFIDKILINPQIKKIYLEIFSEIINQANSHGDEKWGVRCKTDSVRLLLGGIVVASIHRDSLWLTMDMELLKKTDKELLTDLELDWDKGDWAYFRAINLRNLYYTDKNKIKWEKIKHIHFEAIKKAAEKYTKLNIKSRKNISFEFLEYLDAYLNIITPKPNKIEVSINELLTGKENELDELIRLENEIRDSKPKIRKRISKQIERGEIAKVIKSFNNYECQICKELGLNPLSFRNKKGVNYIETHHVIEVSKLIKGSLGISNLLTLCANHHRQMHLGNVELLDNQKYFFKFKIDEDIVVIKKIILEK